jgi:hypothetical protein
MGVLAESDAESIKGRNDQVEPLEKEQIGPLDRSTLGNDFRIFKKRSKPIIS